MAKETIKVVDVMKKRIREEKLPSEFDPVLDMILEPWENMDLWMPEEVPENDEDEEDEDEAEYVKEIRIYDTTRRSFLFHPSFADSYWEIKKIDPEKAVKYIEALMNYGVDLNNEIPNDPIIKIALMGPMRVIDKAYCSYLERVHKDNMRRFEAYKKKQQG